MQAPQRKQVAGLIFDSSLESIDQVLALALVFGFEGRREIRLASVSVSRNNLKTAAFLDLVCRVYAGEPAAGFAQNRNVLPVGMFGEGTTSAAAPPMLEAALSKPVYKRAVEKLNDTADAVALIRNALTAQTDENAAVILAGPPANLLALLALSDGRQWAARKARVLMIAAGRFDSSQPDPVLTNDAAGFRKLLAGWPGPVVFAGAEIGESLPFPAASIESDFAWAPNHPITDAYRASQQMPYDAPARAMAAALYAAQPNENYFRLSEPGTIDVLDDGRTQFTPSANGRHRYLIVDPAQKERVIQTYTQTASAKPPAPQGRGRPPAAAAKILIIGAMAGLLASAPFRVAGQDPADFDKSVRPLLTETCSQCHNSRLASGGLDVTALLSPDSLNSNRPTWE